MQTHTSNSIRIHLCQAYVYQVLRVFNRKLPSGFRFWNLVGNIEARISFNEEALKYRFLALRIFIFIFLGRPKWSLSWCSICKTSLCFCYCLFDCLSYSIFTACSRALSRTRIIKHPKNICIKFNNHLGTNVNRCGNIKAFPVGN